MLLRIKESEIQYLKQEIHSLKDELQSALRVSKANINVLQIILKRHVFFVLNFAKFQKLYHSFLNFNRTRNMPQKNIKTSIQSSAL